VPPLPLASTVVAVGPTSLRAAGTLGLLAAQAEEVGRQGGGLGSAVGDEAGFALVARLLSVVDSFGHEGGDGIAGLRASSLLVVPAQFWSPCRLRARDASAVVPARCGGR
jgi:hypothetical protein